MKKIVLAYSGGLDTSVAVKWLADKYNAQIIALLVDVGQGEDLVAAREKACQIGAAKAILIDARKEFVNDYIIPAVTANAVYEDAYPLTTALSRPLIAKLLVDIAQQENADAIAHGCTGKGNDQVRFDVSTRTLAPSLKIIAPAREWDFTRETAIEYAKKNGIPTEITHKKPYSIDANLWGRSIECGVLEDAWVEPPEDIYELTAKPYASEAEYIDVYFEEGIPLKINDKGYPFMDIIMRLNKLAGAHGVGRIDHIENRLVGIKSREIYEAPAAQVLLTAHKALEGLTLPRELLHFKKMMEQKFSELTYYGLWFSPLQKALQSFMETTQKTVTGNVRCKLHQGTCMVVGRKSPFSLYDKALATYDKGDTFDHKSAEGFIKLWGLDSQTFADVNMDKYRAGQKNNNKGIENVSETLAKSVK